MKRKRLNLFSIILIVFVSSYLINLLWEVAHSLLYNWNQFPLKNDVYFYIPKILGATIGDAVTISVIFLINCFLRRGFKWICSPKKIDYFVFILFGLAFAIGIEVRAMLLDLWSYNQYMPLVLGIGLTPLVQLAITGVGTLFLTNKLICNR